MLLVFTGWCFARFGLLKGEHFMGQINVLLLRVAFPMLNIYLLVGAGMGRQGSLPSVCSPHKLAVSHQRGHGLKCEGNGGAGLGRGRGFGTRESNPADATALPCGPGANTVQKVLLLLLLLLLLVVVLPLLAPGPDRRASKWTSVTPRRGGAAKGSWRTRACASAASARRAWSRDSGCRAAGE